MWCRIYTEEGLSRQYYTMAMAINLVFGEAEEGIILMVYSNMLPRMKYE
jgi:hypothetical protein